MRSAVLFVVLAALTACQTSHVGSPSAVSRPPRARALQPVLLDTDEPVVHEASGFRFPVRQGGFRRIAAYRYDDEGREMGVVYRNVRPGCAVDAAFAVYPVSEAHDPAVANRVGAAPAPSLAQELAHAREEWKRGHDQLELVAEGETSTPGAFNALEGPFARFRERGQISEIQIFLYEDKWFLRYAFTYPERCATEADERIAAVVERLPWAAAIPPAPGTVCEDLAYTFFLIAENRDRGHSRSDQEAMVRESIRTPFVANPEETRRNLLRVVDVVYRSPDATPEEIEAGVLDHCVVDDQGHAVVRRPAPRP